VLPARGADGPLSTDSANVRSVDESVVSSAVESFVPRSSFGVFVDPRPVRIADAVAYPDPTDYYAGAEQEIASRSTALAQLAVDTATAFPLASNCSALLAPPQNKVTSGCPKEDRIVLALDRARPGSEANRWIMRLMAISYAPRGRSAEIWNLTIARKDGAHFVEDQRLLVVID
jgi:hypothetical protein